MASQVRLDDEAKTTNKLAPSLSPENGDKALVSSKMPLIPE